MARGVGGRVEKRSNVEQVFLTGRVEQQVLGCSKEETKETPRFCIPLGS
jgi:hypothetical protein